MLRIRIKIIRTQQWSPCVWAGARISSAAPAWLATRAVSAPPLAARSPPLPRTPCRTPPFSRWSKVFSPLGSFSAEMRWAVSTWQYYLFPFSPLYFITIVQQIRIKNLNNNLFLPGSNSSQVGVKSAGAARRGIHFNGDPAQHTRWTHFLSKLSLQAVFRICLRTQGSYRIQNTVRIRIQVPILNC